MYYLLFIITGIAVLVSSIVNFNKTLKALQIGFIKFINILPAFLLLLILVSIVLFFVSDDVIIKYLGTDNKLVGVIFAAFFGSITLLPGFIAFPLGSILLEKGISYIVLAVFTTTLMMVGILTYPVEKRYFGKKVAIIRNVISFFIALIVAITIGIFFGEVL